MDKAIKPKTIREDGYIFDGYQTTKGRRYPVWRNPDAYAKREEYKRLKQKAMNLTQEQAERLRKAGALRAARRRKNKAGHINALRRAIYPADRIALLAKNAAWRKENWQQVLESRRRPQYAIAAKLRSRVLCAVKQQRVKKSAATEALLGCATEDAMKHLESQFKEGMTWNNHRQWHIDHIRPCASFDLTKPEQQRECFHFTNLQPLWGFENLSKGSKIPVAA